MFPLVVHIMDQTEVCEKNFLNFFFKGYKIFGGRDATRAFVTGCFDPAKEECLSDKIDDFTEQQKKDLEEWVQFYLTSSKYFLVGKLKK
jgi:hypothetical protein